MEGNPLATDILFQLGPIPISAAVVTTWAIMILLAGISWLGMRRPQVHPGGLQLVLELVVETIASQLEDIVQRNPRPYLPLIGTLFILAATGSVLRVSGWVPRSIACHTKAAKAMPTGWLRPSSASDKPVKPSWTGNWSLYLKC